MTGGSLTREGTLAVLLARLGGVAGSLVLGQVIIGVAYVVVARALSPAMLGVIATSVAVAAIAATVFDAGLTDFTVREVASGHLEMAEARGLVRTKRRLAVLLVLPVAGVSLVITPTPVLGAILGLLAFATWEAVAANGLLRAQERFARAATGQLVGRGTGLVVVVALQAALPVYALPVGLLVAYVVEAAVGRVSLGRARAPARRQREVWGLYRQGVGYGLTSLAASAQQLATPLVAAGGGAASAGLYAAAARLLGPLGFLPTSLALVGSPWLATAKHDPVALRGEERRILRVAAVACVAPLVVAAAGPYLIPLLLGEQYRASGTVFLILAIGSVFSTANQPLAVILQNRGFQQRVAAAVGIGLGVGLAATFFLAVAGGAVLAAVGFTVSQIYILTHLGATVVRTRAAVPAGGR